jgi:hypothetical protein
MCVWDMCGDSPLRNVYICLCGTCAETHECMYMFVGHVRRPCIYMVYTYVVADRLGMCAVLVCEVSVAMMYIYIYIYLRYAWLTAMEWPWLGL